MIPFFINKSKENYNIELEMAKQCIESLERCEYTDLIFYNQGGFSNKELMEFLMNFNIKFKIIGEGTNDGIPIARYSMLKYINENYKNAKYVAEIHLDMLFTPTWDKPLIKFLEESDEPMISPRIISLHDNVYTVTGKAGAIKFPKSLAERIKVMESYIQDYVGEGFVHPVIHKLEALNSINAYDIGFLTGKQGYEDDSILLGYNYYMGTRNNWRPKICFKSCVYHKIFGQRLKLENLGIEFGKNLNGLKIQYGAYGQKELMRIHGGHEFFGESYESMIVDNQAYKRNIKEYKEYTYNDVYINNLYNSRYFTNLDEYSESVFLKIPTDWWSRIYEYHWASKFANPQDICLDAACGIPHPFKFYLASICKEVHAVDSDLCIEDNDKIIGGVNGYFRKSDVEKAKSQIDKIKFKQNNITKLDYCDNYFDKIYFISTIHQLKDEEVLGGLKELKRVLKENGLLIITFDVPSIDIDKLICKVYEVGFKIKGDLNLNRPETAIYSNLLSGLYCYRMVLTK